jgi:Homeodomain-like domain
MRRTEAFQGVRMTVFLTLLPRWESAELNQAEAAGLLGVSERTFRRWTRRHEEEGKSRACRRPAWQGLGQAGSGRSGAGGGAALPRALPGFYGQAFPRASGEGPRLRLELHLDQAAFSMGGAGAQGGASAQARAASAAGDDAASGRLAPRLARGPRAARSDRHDG